MAAESNIIVLHTRQGKPSEKAFLVGIPMDMYRLKTQDFSGGLDFFQHTILRFKERLDISDKDIIQFTGFDEKLVELVINSLKPTYISHSGVITDEGRFALSDPHHLIAKSSQKINKPGYVFKLPAINSLLNDYVEEISPVDNYKKEGVLQLVEEDSKGDEKFSPVVVLSRNTKHSTTAPLEREIIHRIEMKYCIEQENECVYDIKNRQIAIQFVPDKTPTKVLVCTYIYLPQINANIYASDWVVMDPFNDNNGTSPQLKFYVESLNDENLQLALTQHFATAPSLEKLSFGELRRQLEEKVQTEIDLLWGDAFSKLDRNLQTYIRIVLCKKKEMGYCHFESREHSQSFISNIQEALETILKIDKHSRSIVYQYNRVEYDENLTKRKFSKILRGDCAVETSVFNKLYKDLKDMMKNNSEPKSLKQFLPEFILSYENKITEPLFVKIVQNLNLIVEIAYSRNDHDHGHTEEEGLLTALSSEDVNRYYQIFTEIITTLTNTK